MLKFDSISDQYCKTSFGEFYDSYKDSSERTRSFGDEAMSDIVEYALLRLMPLNFVCTKDMKGNGNIILQRGIQVFEAIAEYVENKFPIKGKYIKELAGLKYSEIGRQHQRRLMYTSVCCTTLSYNDEDSKTAVLDAISMARVAD